SPENGPALCSLGPRRKVSFTSSSQKPGPWCCRFLYLHLRFPLWLSRAQVLPWFYSLFPRTSETFIITPVHPPFPSAHPIAIKLSSPSLAPVYPFLAALAYRIRLS